MTCRKEIKPTLAQAIECGDVDHMDILLRDGCDVNGPMGRDGWPAICCAVASRQIRVIAWLLNRGADPNQAIRRGVAQGMVALDFCQDVSIGKLLLEAGARIDMVDKHGSTPLDWASFMVRKDMIALLIGGASIYPPTADISHTSDDKESM
jgi:ankyrin repeat protein